jgi:hypothetical protein
MVASSAALTDAFTEGTTFGRSGNAEARSRVDADTARTIVPGYTPSAPASSYFGAPGLTEGATATIADCARATHAASPACQAINFSQTNAGRRPSFTLTPSDPLLAKAKSIAADPHSIAGHLTGTYSACTIQTRSTPDVFEKRICNEYRTLERQTCEKTLLVSVTDNGLSCSAGAFITDNPRIQFIRPYVYVGALCADDIRFLWTYGYSECNGTDASIFVTTVVPTEAYTRLIVNLGCGGVYYVAGSCPDGHCAYSVGEPDAEIGCRRTCDGECCDPIIADYALATFSFERARRTYTINDVWDNRCASFEARLP